MPARRDKSRTHSDADADADALCANLRALNLPFMLENHPALAQTAADNCTVLSNVSIFFL